MNKSNISNISPNIPKCTGFKTLNQFKVSGSLEKSINSKSCYQFVSKKKFLSPSISISLNLSIFYYRKNFIKIEYLIKYEKILIKSFFNKFFTHSSKFSLLLITSNPKELGSFILIQLVDHKMKGLFIFAINPVDVKA